MKLKSKSKFVGYDISEYMDCDGAASEIDDELEQDRSGCLKNGYFVQLIDDANKRCNQARSLAMSTINEVPARNKNIKADILRCCKVYSPSHSNWCVGFEIELTGILSEYYRRRHGHVFEALGFSFATPLLIEVMFQPLAGISVKSTSQLISSTFRGLWAMHGDRDIKVPPMEMEFVYNIECDDEQDYLYKQLTKVIDLSKSNPMDIYGLRFLLPRIAKDFFSRGGDQDSANNVLLASEDNIFVRFLLFTGSRLASLLKRCIVCVKELRFTASKLCSCSDELCLFGFEVLGLGSQVLQEVVRLPPELIDLEISHAFAAANSRTRDVFEPFPPFLLEKSEIGQRSDVLNTSQIANPKANTNQIANPKAKPKHIVNPKTKPNQIPNPNQIANPKSKPNPIANPNANPNSKNMVALRSIIESFPSASEMRLSADEAELKAKLAKSWLSTPHGKSAEKLGDEYFGKKISELPYNVLRFILSTNRLSLVFLSGNDKFLERYKRQWRFYQFSVVQDSPETEVAGNTDEVVNKCKHKHEVSGHEVVNKCKHKHEVSRFGFHGSGPVNWYSILRNGLRCLSNTELESTGHVLGDGIYLSDRLEISTHFAHSNVNHWRNGTYKDGVFVVSICEVISSPVIESDVERGTFVVPKEHEGKVAVRYLIVFRSLKEFPNAHISDGHILSYGDRTVDLSQHYEKIRKKYASR